MAAVLRPDPEQFTDSTPPPTTSRIEEAKLAELLAACDITDLAVHGRRWPAGRAAIALLAVAGDPDTRSPMRLAEAGPWWDEPAAISRPDPAEQELAELEGRLDDTDGHRVTLQRQARAKLAAEGQPVTRLTVSRRACELLER